MANRVKPVGVNGFSERCAGEGNKVFIYVDWEEMNMSSTLSTDCN